MRSCAHGLDTLNVEGGVVGVKRERGEMSKVKSNGVRTKSLQRALCNLLFKSSQIQKVAQKSCFVVVVVEVH